MSDDDGRYGADEGTPLGIGDGFIDPEDTLHELLDTLRLGTCVLDRSGTVMFLSGKCRKMLRLGPDRGIGEPWQSLCNFTVPVLEALTERLQNPHSDQHISANLILPGRGEVWYEIDVQPDPRDSQRRFLIFYDVSEVHSLQDQLAEISQDGIVDDRALRAMGGRSQAIRMVFQQIRELSRHETTVLITGETGSGKEVVARALHEMSPRRDGPFVAVNSAGLTESLIASQLFGHLRGAFTGAVSEQRGVFEAAHGGTVFLDEIGDLPLSLQSNLLRVLETRQITRLGESMARPVDIRILAATHRDLQREVRAGRFREDLLYRLRVGRIHVPALRERREDIPALAGQFLRILRVQLAKPHLTMLNDAVQKLMTHDWPGNVRELRNAIEAAAVRCRGQHIGPADLDLSAGPPDPAVLVAAPAQPAPAAAQAPAGPAARTTLKLPSRKERVLKALEQAQGNRAVAARILGVGRTTLYRWMERYEIDTSSPD